MELSTNSKSSVLDDSTRALEMADAARTPYRRKRALEAVRRARAKVRHGLAAPPPKTGNWSTARVTLLDARLERAESELTKETK